MYSFGDPSPVKRQLFRLAPGLSAWSFRQLRDSSVRVLRRGSILYLPFTSLFPPSFRSPAASLCAGTHPAAALERLLFLGWFEVLSHTTSRQEPPSTCSALPVWGSYLEQGTNVSVVSLQGPQLLSGCFLELGIEALGGTALNREEE